MRRAMSVLVVIIVVMGLAGCDAVQRKFTRKSKTVKAPRIYQIRKYDIKPSADLYSKHYAYWQSWQSELIQDLGQNHKKDKRCIEEILMQLGAMQNILVREKADELGKHIARLEDVRDTITKQEIDKFNRSGTLMVLEREDRYIKTGFPVSKIKNYIRESFDEGPQAQAELPRAGAAAAAQEEK